MATVEQIADLRRIADEPGTETYTDVQLSALVDSRGSVESAAAYMWQAKAGKYASLVNTSESGSSRSMGDLYKNALAMAKFYGDLVSTPDVPETPTASGPFTVEISRS